MSRAMKDSGIEWIGQIPEHWKIKRVKDICSSNSSTLSDNTKDDYEFSYVDIGSVNFENGIISSEVFRFKNAPSRARRIAKLNDIVVSTVRTYLRAIDIIDTEEKANYVYSTGFAILSPQKNNLSKFIIHICRSEYFTFQVSLLSNGINYPSINSTNMNCISVFMPPIEEQQQIADYLDTKCAEVDELIALQEKMIDELKVYKQSVITEAVTKGLNPDAPLKDSGIEWIGQIPQHWEVRRLKNIGSAQNGLTYSPIDVCDENQGILVLRSSNIQNGKLAFDDNVYVSVNKVPNNLLVCKGDIIICSRNGSASLVGKSALVTDDISACFGAFMMRFRSNEDYRYTYNLLTAAITQYKQLFSTSTINQLTIGIFSGLAMPFTRNKEEQQQIADYLDTKCAEIDEMTSIKQKKIEQLKEYKKSIIYEYVTGKRQII